MDANDGDAGTVLSREEAARMPRVDAVPRIAWELRDDTHVMPSLR